MTARAILPRVRAQLSVILMLLAMLAAGITLAGVATRGDGAKPSEAQQIQQIAAGLHCPVCKDLSVADSPAPLAQQMREQIAQKLRAGETPDQIRAGFVAAYGDSVLMSPPKRGLSAAVYVLPMIVIAAGLVVAVTLVRRWVRRPEVEPDEDDAVPMTASDRRAVLKAVARLREEEPA
jgi:cytochrome c-type biogenesis protein CcmH